MATASRSCNWPGLICQICSKFYSDPVILPCLHSYCKRCLQKVTSQTEGGGYLLCPTCEENIKLSDNNIEAFVSNLWLAHHVEIDSYQKMIKAGEPVSCGRCGNLATVSCGECVLVLCLECEQDHQRCYDTKHHVLTPLSEVNDLTLPHKIMECSKHIKKLKLFCQSCDMMICRDCTINDHNLHNIHLIDDIIKQEKDTTKEKSLKLAETLARIDDTISATKSIKSQLILNKDQLRKEICQIFEKMRLVLAQREEVLVKESDKAATAKITTMEIHIEQLEKIKKRITFAHKAVSTITDTSTPQEFLALRPILVKAISMLTKSLSHLPLTPAVDGELDSVINYSIVEKAISMLGDVFGSSDPGMCVIAQGMAIPFGTIGKEKKFKMQLRRSDGGIYKGKEIVKCVLTSDKMEEVVFALAENGMAYFSFNMINRGEHILNVSINDCPIYGSPFSVYAYPSRDYKAISSPLEVYSLMSSCVGIAVNSNGDVFTTSSNGFISKYDKSSKRVTTINNKQLVNNPYRMTLLGDILYIVDSSNHRVQKFMSTTGEAFGQFGSRGSGDGQLYNPKGITHNGKGQVLVADCNNKRVQIFEANGSFVQSIDCNGQSPYDVAVDNEGNIHVAYCSQHPMQIFASDGKPLSTYNLSIQCIQAIAINNEGNRFIVSGYSRGTTTINKGSSNQTLFILDSMGKQINTLSDINNSIGVALDKEGYIYIADLVSRNNSRVLKY